MAMFDSIQLLSVAADARLLAATFDDVNGDNIDFVSSCFGRQESHAACTRLSAYDEPPRRRLASSAHAVYHRTVYGLERHRPLCGLSSVLALLR